MKRMNFILPIVAVMVAVAGVFATGNKEIGMASINVHASTITTNCIKDGTCDQSNGNACSLNSGYTFNIIVTGIPTTCSATATGVFSL